jgi:hypothetical protein
MHPEVTGPVKPPKVKTQRGPMSTMSLGLGIMVVLLLATVALSPLAMSSHSSERIIMIPPNSYYALRFNFYGLGFLDYLVDAPGSVPQSGVILRVMTDGDYVSYASDEPYQTIGVAPLGPGGSVTSSEGGAMWARVLVFENNTPMTVSMTVSYSSVPIFSILVAAPIFALGLLVFAVMVNRRRLSKKQM